jgi:hypothetical protein
MALLLAKLLLVSLIVVSSSDNAKNYIKAPRAGARRVMGDE